MTAPTFVQLILEAYRHLEDADDALRTQVRRSLTKAEQASLEDARSRLAAAKRALATMSVPAATKLTATKEEPSPDVQRAVACAR